MTILCASHPAEADNQGRRSVCGGFNCSRNSAQCSIIDQVNHIREGTRCARTSPFSQKASVLLAKGAVQEPCILKCRRQTNKLPSLRNLPRLTLTAPTSARAA